MVGLPLVILKCFPKTKKLGLLTLSYVIIKRKNNLKIGLLRKTSIYKDVSVTTLKLQK
jgi:hypothetical protein